MCRVYGVSRHGYYAWKRRGKSNRTFEDEALTDEIFKIWHQSGKVYGSPKIIQALKQQGFRVSQKRVARLMRENGIKARVATFYRNNKKLKDFVAAIPNRELDVMANKPDQVWVGDVTYLKVKGEWRYLSVIMDKCSRKVVGWSLKDTRDASLTLKSLKQALKNRKPEAGLVFHSDRGIEYRARLYSKRLEQRGIIQSMNRPKVMNDNAHMESFFHNFKAERYHGRKFNCENSLRGVITRYIGFYNNQRLHSSLGYLPPSEYERKINKDNNLMCAKAG